MLAMYEAIAALETQLAEVRAERDRFRAALEALLELARSAVEAQVPVSSYRVRTIVQSALAPQVEVKFAGKEGS